MVAIPHATLVFSKIYEAFSVLNIWPKPHESIHMVQTIPKKKHQDFSLKPPLTSPITYSQKPGNRNPSPTWRPGHPRSDIQKAEIAPPAATQSIHRKIVAKKKQIPQLNFRSPSFRTLADATPKETKRLWSRSRENHEMNLPISQCKIHTMCSFYTQYCQEINISFPKASIPHLKMFQGQLVLRQIQVLNHWHGLFCPAYVWLTIVTPLLCRPIKMPTWIHKMFTSSSSRVPNETPMATGFSVDLPTKLLSCNLQASPPSH